MNKYMEIALKEAQKAFEKEEVPIGCVIVSHDKIIAKSHNNREKKHNILGHAEIIAIKKASKRLKTWKLDNCEMYVTLKPCSMCESVIKQSRIRKVYYLLAKNATQKEYYKTEFLQISQENKYAKLLSDFFKNKR